MDLKKFLIEKIEFKRTIVKVNLFLNGNVKRTPKRWRFALDFVSYEIVRSHVPTDLYKIIEGNNAFTKAVAKAVSNMMPDKNYYNNGSIYEIFLYGKTDRTPLMVLSAE